MVNSCFFLTNVTVVIFHFCWIIVCCDLLAKTECQSTSKCVSEKRSIVCIHFSDILGILVWIDFYHFWYWKFLLCSWVSKVIFLFCSSVCPYNVSCTALRKVSHCSQFFLLSHNFSSQINLITHHKHYRVSVFMQCFRELKRLVCRSLPPWKCHHYQSSC